MQVIGGDASGSYISNPAPAILPIEFLALPTLPAAAALTLWLTAKVEHTE